MRLGIPLSLLLLLAAMPSSAQHSHSHDTRPIVFPDVPGFQTLACDFHMHSVFSDGAVWPSIRVQEAIKDDLDCIAITEHIEYLPHQADIPYPDRLRAYDLALEAAAGSDLVVISGSEITRSMPPGHANAIFITDPNKLIIDDAVEAYQEAGKQGAFIFWNHPDWTSHRKDGMARLEDMHRGLMADNLLHGIEVVNLYSYSAEALQIALDYDLTIIGTSDVHGLIDWDYNVADGGHRPVTLVFSEDRSETGIHDGLRKKRTVVWHDNYLIGRPEFLEPLVQSSLEITSAVYEGDTSILEVKFMNHSDAEFLLKNMSIFTLKENYNIIKIAPNHETILRVKTVDFLEDITLDVEVLNAIVAPQTFLETSFTIAVSS